MYNINTIAFETVSVCEDIVFMLDTVSSEANIRSLLGDYLRKNKEIIGLDRYYITLKNNDNVPQVTIEFSFCSYPDDLEIMFSHTPAGYKASLRNLCLIVSNPLHYDVDGFIYCNYDNHYLYVDQFTNYAPTSYSEREVALQELIEDKIHGLNGVKIKLLNSFLEKLHSNVRKTVRVLNIDSIEISDEFSEYNELVRDYIDSYDITCIVTTQQDIHDSIEKYSPCSVIVYSLDDFPPRITKTSWARRAISLIKKEYDFTQDYKGLYDSIRSLMRNFDISKNTIRDVCVNEFDNKEGYLELYELSKYLPFIKR